MKKFWLVFRYEYLRHVKRKRFIFALVSIPLFVVLTIGIGFLSVWLQTDQRPAGYVDLSGVLANAKPIPSEESSLIAGTRFEAFANAEAADKALQAGKIQGFFVLPADYYRSGKVEYITQESIKNQTEDDFFKFMRYNLAANLPVSVRERVVQGSDIVVRTLDGSRSSGEADFVNIIIPFVTGLVFIIVINISGSYLVQALVEEKENRTMEIVVTSVSSQQLMAGKVVGNLSVGLTQLIIWILVGFVGLSFANVNLDFELNLEPRLIALSVVTLLPAFVMVAGLMATAGATTTESREAQQVAGYFTLPIVLPYWFMVNLIESPNSPVSIGLSLFPLTAPVALPMRAAVTEIPFWQLILSVGLICVCAVGAVWIAGRAFRLGMLRYGQKLRWKEIFGKGGAQ